MEILVKRLFDEYGIKEYIFYEPGNFLKPLFILTEGYAEKLKRRLDETIDDNEYIIKRLN